MSPLLGLRQACVPKTPSVCLRLVLFASRSFFLFCFTVSSSTCVPRGFTTRLNYLWQLICGYSEQNAQCTHQCLLAACERWRFSPNRWTGGIRRKSVRFPFFLGRREERMTVRNRVRRERWETAVDTQTKRGGDEKLVHYAVEPVHSLSVGRQYYLGKKIECLTSSITRLGLFSRRCKITVSQHKYGIWNPTIFMQVTDPAWSGVDVPVGVKL